MKRALYVGKFEPFHIGHMEVVKYIESAPDIDEIIVGIGSSQWNWQNRNPERPWLDNIFTWQERKEIIESSLKPRLSKKFYVIPIFDFLPKWGADSTPKWLNYIKTHCPEFHCLYTNRKGEIDLFSRAGYETRPHQLKYGFSATIVREKMALKGIWQPFVCPEAIEVIRKADGEKRAAELFSKAEINPEDYADLRWEWRTFDRPDEADIKKIMGLPVFGNDNTCDRYLFSLTRSTVNFKLRKDGLKIKKLLTARDSLEVWTSLECAFPVERDWLVQGCKEIKFPLPAGLPETVCEKDLLNVVPKEVNPYLFLLPVEKRVFRRIFQDGKSRCGIDVTVLTLNGRNITTVGLEAKDKEDVERVLGELGLGKYQPANYLQFLEKFVCWEAKDESIWKKL